MNERDGLVSQRVWNVTALAAGVAAAAITLLTAYNHGWEIGSWWIAMLSLALLNAVEILLATSLLGDVEIRLSNLGLTAALLALGPYPAMLTAWVGITLAEAIRALSARATRIMPRRSSHNALMITLQGAAASVIIVWAGNLIFVASGGDLDDFSLTPARLLPLLLLLLSNGTLTALTLLWRLVVVEREPVSFLLQHRASPLMHILAASLVGILLADAYRSQQTQVAVFLTAALTLLLLMMRRARQNRTTLEHRIKQLGVLGDISHRLSTSLELDEVLEAVYQEASHLFEASEFYLALYDDQSEIIDFVLIIRRGKRLPRQRRALGNSITDHVIRSRQSILLTNGVEKQLRQMGVDVIGQVPLSYVAAPILVGKEVLGVIAIQHYEKPAIYSPDDASLLETLAAQAATALQNARLYQRVSRQAEQLASLNQAFTLMGASLDSDEVIERVCELAMQVMGAQKVAVFMRVNQGDVMRMVNHIGLSEKYVADSQNIQVGKSERTRVVTQNAPLIITDVTTDPQMAGILELAAQEGFRAIAEVPLRIERRVIGSLAIYYENPRFFEANEVALLSALGGQVAIAVENAHLFERTSIELSHRVRELETIEGISREMTSRLNLNAVMQQLIDAAAAATDADFIEIALLDEHERVLNSVAKKEDINLTYDEWPADKGVSGRSLRTGEAILVHDVRQDPDYVPGHPESHSELVAPIIHGERRLGVINLESMQTNAFTDEHRRFVMMLSKHAAIAVENARLFESVRKQALDLEALRSAATALLVAPNVEQALAVIAEHALILTGAQDIHVYLYDEETGLLTFGTSLWDSGERNVEFAKPRPDGLTARVARSGRMIAIENMAEHPLFKPVAKKTKDPRWAIGAIAGVPVTRGERVIGVFNIAFREPRSFTEQELYVLDLLAAQAAVAIDHAQLMEQIQEAHDRLQVILDSTYDGILMFDNRFRLMMANQRAEYILGIRSDKHQGQTILQLVDHLLQEYGPDAVGFTREDAEALVAEIQEAPNTITRRRYEPGNPRLRAAEVITAPVNGESEEIIGRLVILRDATHEVEMEQYRQELTGMIVHDLRSPLSGIITSLHFAMSELQEERPDLESTEASLSIAFSCAEQQLQLIETLLDINKLSSGELLSALGKVNIAHLAEEAITTFRASAREANITLSLFAPPDLSPLSADEATLRRVFTNLLDNAMNYTPEGGSIRIDVQAYPTHQQITVSDTGPGIPEKDRERVFERFIQLDKHKRMRGPKGSGLGLTFCKLAIEAHGGRIWVDMGPEGGAAFHFTLPVDLQAPPR